jgi:methionyl-tRNA formyltransferase
MAVMINLILSPYPQRIIPIIYDDEHETGNVLWAEELPKELMSMFTIDWIISYGFRHIIKEPWLNAYKGRIINIHISLLPWNRGADPNFWSWFDDTPKGISIHEVAKGLDTGPVYFQGEAYFNANEWNHTLATTYYVLHQQAIESFKQIWPQIKSGLMTPIPQTGKGSYHKAIDKIKWFDQLTYGYNTPVYEVMKLGEKSRCQKQ